MTEPKKLSRRDFLKGAAWFGLGVGGTLGVLELKRRGLHIDIGFAPALTPMPGTEIPTPANIIPTPVGGGEAFPQVVAPESLVYPDRWAETPQAAAELFGGKAEYWRKDIYVDPQDKQTKWGGAWVMEAYQLKVPFQADGRYVDQSGQPLPQDQIYDFNVLLEKVNVGFGPYAETYQAHGTSWDGQMYKAGTGRAVFDQAVQAVIRPITLKCIEGSDVVAQFKDEAKQRTAEEFSRYLFNDPQADNLVAGLWSDDQQNFKFINGRGWSNYVSEPVTDIKTREALSPDRWAETPQAAAELFGGKAEYWRKDIYVDPQDGQTKWGGTWVMEAYQLKTQYKADGLYVDQFGKPLPQDQIYDFNTLLERVDVDFGPYAETYQAHGTSWDGQMYKAGTGHAVFEQAIQAVMRPITLKCIEGSDIVAQFRDEAKQRTAEEFSRYLFYDPQADSLVAGLWDETKGKFKLLSGVGWRASLSSLLVGFFFGPEKGGDKLA